ncbi:hypothetical protein J2T13_004143 [Paenibacillus sp. DS2015]
MTPMTARSARIVSGGATVASEFKNTINYV